MASGFDAFEELCDDRLARNPALERTKRMGMPDPRSDAGKAGTSAPARLRRAYAANLKRNGKLVAGFVDAEDAMVFKLADCAEHAEALALEGAHLFDPGGRGRPFNQWAVMPPAHAKRWPNLAQAALF